MADSRKEGLVEVLVLCDEACLGHSQQDFSSSSAQQIASWYPERKLVGVV